MSAEIRKLPTRPNVSIPLSEACGLITKDMDDGGGPLAFAVVAVCADGTIAFHAEAAPGVPTLSLLGAMDLARADVAGLDVPD